MSWYDDIANHLEKYNDTDIEIKIDDICEEGIDFCVFFDEVDECVLRVIEDTLNYIKKDDIDLTSITYTSQHKGDAECFNLRYRIKVGEDLKSDYELYQESEDYRQEQAFESQRGN